MPPNQHVMGGCNQIISLRFGFPNSFPLVLSTDHSLALKKGRGGLQDKLGHNRQEEEREDMIEEWRMEERSGGVCGGFLFFTPPWPRPRVMLTFTHFMIARLSTFHKKAEINRGWLDSSIQAFPLFLSLR